MPRFSFRSAVVAVAAFGVVRAADPVPAAPPVSSLPPTVAAAAPTVDLSATGTQLADPTAAAAPTAGDTTGACGSLCGGGGGCSGDGWIGVEWLYWGATGHRLPPLLVADAGGGATRVVAGDRTYNDDWRNGFRLYAGLWIGALHRVGFDGDFFFLGRSRFRDAAVSDASAGSPALARPFDTTVRRNPNGTFTPIPPTPAFQFVAVPGLLAGTFTADMTSEFSGAGVNLVKNLTCDPCAAYRCSIGYRYLNLTDTLFIQNELLTGGPAPTGFLVNERFRVENHFSGVPLGLSCERQAGPCFLSVRAAVSLGVTRTVVDVDGSTVISTPTAAQGFTGGLLALPSNIGDFTHDSFAVVPEVGVRVGMQVWCARLYVGYNFLYWSSVVRAGGVIDTRVNTSQQPNNGPVTGPLFPRFQARTTDFFAHGAMIGLEFSF